MFGFSIWELLLTLTIALIVLGPERLPQAAYTAGLWVKRIQRFLHSLKMGLTKEMEEVALAKRIEQAAKVSDVSDLVSKQSQPADKPHDNG
jgi:sec-independent protein translocase protein TatB